jgi:hypothetical protein
MDLKEEEMFIIGVSGLEVHHFKAMQLLLELSIVSLEHKHFLFGKQYVILLRRKTENTNQLFY